MVGDGGWDGGLAELGGGVEGGTGGGGHGLGDGRGCSRGDSGGSKVGAGLGYFGCVGHRGEDHNFGHVELSDERRVYMEEVVSKGPNRSGVV